MDPAGVRARGCPREGEKDIPEARGRPAEGRKSGCVGARGTGFGAVQAPGRQLDDAPGILSLALAEQFEQRVDGPAGRAEQLAAVPSHLIEDRVLWSFVGHAQGSSNSSGVQRTGGSYPNERTVRSIDERARALAMCLQFHVSR